MNDRPQGQCKERLRKEHLPRQSLPSFAGEATANKNSLPGWMPRSHGNSGTTSLPPHRSNTQPLPWPHWPQRPFLVLPAPSFLHHLSPLLFPLGLEHGSPGSRAGSWLSPGKGQP